MFQLQKCSSIPDSFINLFASSEDLNEDRVKLELSNHF